jgi:hypothetical protein
MRHSQQLQVFHCCSQFQGFFVLLKVVMMPLTSGKLLEMLPPTLEVPLSLIHKNLVGLIYTVVGERTFEFSYFPLFTCMIDECTEYDH